VGAVRAVIVVCCENHMQGRNKVCGFVASIRVVNVAFSWYIKRHKRKIYSADFLQ
jgi:hypothetical protein